MGKWIIFVFGWLSFAVVQAQGTYYILDGDTVYGTPPQFNTYEQTVLSEPIQNTTSYVSSSVNAQLQRLDSLTARLFFKPQWFDSDSAVYAKIYMHNSMVPKYSAEEVKNKLSYIPSIVPLDYNAIVQQFIDQFAENRRHFIAKALGLSDYYFPVYEEILDRNDMPIELKYLSVIESGLDPKARSHMGASGPWQFMSRTGKAYGLQVNSFIDERSDIYLATEAASNYLEDLYNIYDDWLLALAAYNAGPGNVNKAISAAGNNPSFWSIRPYLPKETQNYVPLYIACTYMMHYHEDYEIDALRPRNEIFAIDTIMVYDKVSLERIAYSLGIDETYLSMINPTLKEDIIPKSVQGYALRLPADRISNFVANEELILDDPAMYEVEAEIAILQEPTYTVYKVKSGDTLGHIAERFNVGLSKLKAWNNLKSDALRIGQKLTVYN